MNRLVKKTKITSFVIILIIIGITSISFYFPIKKEIENIYLDNFRLLAESKAQDIQHFIDRSLEETKNISSSTAINNKIIEYKNGDISINDLKKFTKGRYGEGVYAFSNIIGSFRIVDNEIIGEYGIIDFQDIDKFKNSSNINCELEVENKNIKLMVYSPILEENHILGHDIISFSMSQYIQEITNKKTNIKFLQGDTLEDNESMLLESNGNIGYLYNISKIDDYIYIYTNKSMLYEPLRKMAFINYKTLVIGLIAIFVTVNYVVFKNSSKVIKDVEISRDLYKKHAYEDSLTGVYSRLFLDTWIKKKFEESKYLRDIYTIAMIDGDKFKEINDNYGHNIGDKVLIKIAHILKESVRERDIVIRYGGDEFLIIFENCRSDMAYSILKRIEEKLEKIHEFKFDIDISYGIYEVENKEDFFDSLSKADEKMYYSKKNK